MAPPHFTVPVVWIKSKLLNNYLLPSGFNVNSKSKSGRNALCDIGWLLPSSLDQPYSFVREPGRREELIHLLLSYTIDTNSSDSDGGRPLHYFVYYGCSRTVVELMIQHGADPISRNSESLTPLENCLLNSYRLPYCTDAIAMLTPLTSSSGIDVNREWYLHRVVEASCGRAVLGQWINHGADINELDELGRTPLDVARKYKNYEAVQFLESIGAASGEHPSKDKESIAVVELEEQLDGRSD